MIYQAVDSIQNRMKNINRQKVVLIGASALCGIIFILLVVIAVKATKQMHNKSSKNKPIHWFAEILKGFFTGILRVS